MELTQHEKKRVAKLLSELAKGRKLGAIPLNQTDGGPPEWHYFLDEDGKRDQAGGAFHASLIGKLVSRGWIEWPGLKARPGKTYQAADVPQFFVITDSGRKALKTLAESGT